MLLDNPNVTLMAVSTLNSAILLPRNLQPPIHYCYQIIDQIYSSRPDLADWPLMKPDKEFFTGGSNSMEQGVRSVTTHQVIKACAIPPSTSTQKAEFIALTRAVHVRKGES
ncbi:Gag-Pol polyprotein, partial [Plecturocebus cupreus]